MVLHAVLLAGSGLLFVRKLSLRRERVTESLRLLSVSSLLCHGSGFGMRWWWESRRRLMPPATLRPSVGLAALGRRQGSHRRMVGWSSCRFREPVALLKKVGGLRASKPPVAKRATLCGCSEHRNVRKMPRLVLGILGDGIYFVDM